MILRQKARDQFYFWYVNSNTTELFVQKNWLWPFVMQYLDFSGWMMKLSKRQDGYFNQQVVLFRLQYETHSLQMHPKSPCRSVVSPTPNLLEQLYALRLLVAPCRYFTSPLYHISYVAVPHLIRSRIHPCCPASPPPWSSSAVFTADLVCHP